MTPAGAVGEGVGALATAGRRARSRRGSMTKWSQRCEPGASRRPPWSRGGSRWLALPRGASQCFAVPGQTEEEE